MATEQECFFVPGHGELANLETACEVAGKRASEVDHEVEVWRVVRTPVRSFKRAVSVTETDLTVPDVTAV